MLQCVLCFFFQCDGDKDVIFCLVAEPIGRLLRPWTLAKSSHEVVHSSIQAVMQTMKLLIRVCFQMKKVWFFLLMVGNGVYFSF